MIKKALVNRSQRGQRAVTTDSVPAPIGGWNARDPEAAMAKTDALWLENWWPGTADITMRKGATKVSTGLNTAVKSLMAYNSPTTQKLFAVNATGVYDVTSGGAVGAPVASVTEGRLNHALFPVLGVTALMAVNGVDKLLMYNGTTWQNIDGTTTPAITGVATDRFSNICIFKRRVWFVEKDTLSAWYLPVNLIGGAALEFPIGQLCHRGGHLVAMAAWTVDAGNGADDNLVFITSEGECVVYSGTDPNSSTGDFKLVGTYFLGEPIGPKCFTKFGGDVLVLTQSGLFPLSKALLSSTVDRSVAISSKIDLIFSQSATAYGDVPGWCGEVFPTENIALFNVPVLEGFQSKQLVMNTITNAWALFSGWNAFCWEIFNKKLYFGGLGFVAEALTGYNDYGSNITARAKTAFNYFGTRLGKHFTLFRPILKVEGDISIDIGLDVNFEDVDTSGTIIFDTTTTDKWDTASWDTAHWAGDYTAKGDWRTVFGKEGFCAALRLRIASKDVKVGWSSTDFAFRKGGVL